LIAQLFEASKYINGLKDGKETISEFDLVLLKKTMHDFIFEVLALVDDTAESSSNTNHLNGALELLISLRNQARANKDFKTSDQIRDQLLEAGIQLKDGKEGTTFSLN
jgi:cysteinyl-tRNA synthetase